LSALFQPLRLRDVEFRNRIGLSPMCMYSCEERDGLANEWHTLHLGARAAGGCGLVMTEATAVSAEGRISPQDLGLWSDAHAEALVPAVRAVTRQGAVAGVQLAHAGRKSGTFRPWSEVRGYVPEPEWTLPRLAPSPVAFRDGAPTPTELDTAGIARLVASFVDAAVRALEIGFELVELHSAHGYLMHQFLSPVSNRRTDGYGGSFEGRTRFHREVVEAVRRVWPERLPLAVRVSATDWVEGGWTTEETVELARMLGPMGVDLFDCSSGGSVPEAEVPVGPGYQVPFAEAVRREAGMASAAVGLITEPDLAEAIVAEGRADMVFLGRELLRDPHWPMRAAQQLGAVPPWPPQYAWAVG
jgi:2,4-dienoyl-CoA reductase-like NADH-dependent reductase (Old Yellow Enzyme family)